MIPSFYRPLFASSKNIVTFLSIAYFPAKEKNALLPQKDPTD
jgi:hypothetical protein